MREGKSGARLKKGNFCPPEESGPGVPGKNGDCTQKQISHFNSREGGSNNATRGNFTD